MRTKERDTRRALDYIAASLGTILRERPLRTGEWSGELELLRQVANVASGTQAVDTQPLRDIFTAG